MAVLIFLKRQLVWLAIWKAAVKASGDDNSTGTNAINLAAIKDSSGTDIVTQIRQGDDTARVVLADAEQLKGLQNASALGESFGIQVPTASAFVSDKPSAVQAIVNTDNSVGLKTSGSCHYSQTLSEPK